MRVGWLVVLAGCGRLGFDASGPGTGDATGDDGPIGAVVHLTASVAGGGRIVSNPTGLDCPGTCAFDVPAGATVTMTATPTSPDLFLGWDTGDCYTATTCTIVATEPQPIHATFSGEHNVVFASSVFVSPVGLTPAIADTACSDSAAVVNLPGTYRGWMSTPTSDIIDRIDTASGWVTIDGLPFAATAADLFAGNTLYPIRYNEQVQSNGQIMPTGTGANGRYTGDACSAWTSVTTTATFGVVDGVHSMFTNGLGSFPCNAGGNSTPLLCFGIGHATPVPTFHHTGRTAFLSSPWSPGGGLADADAHCQADAGVGGLTGTFKAFLAHSGGTPQDRFDLTKPTWVRRDGARILPSASRLGIDGLLTILDLDASGNPTGAGSVFTGSDTTNCSDWTDSGGTTVAGGQVQRALFYFGTGGFLCSQALPLYCLED